MSPWDGWSTPRLRPLRGALSRVSPGYLGRPTKLGFRGACYHDAMSDPGGHTDQYGPLETPGVSASPASQAPWTTGDISRAVAAAVLALLALIGVGAAVVAVADAEAVVGLAVSGSAAAVLVCIAWWFGVRKYGLSWADLGFRWAPGGRSALLCFLAFVLCLAVAGFYGWLIEMIGWDQGLPERPFFEDGNRAIAAAGAALAVLVAPLAEETFFRGFLFGGLRGRIGWWGAAGVSSGLFALAHLLPLLYPPIFFIGLVLAWVYAKTQSLWYPVLVHLGYNGVVVGISLSE